MTWILLSEALHTIPLYVGDQKRKKVQHFLDRFKTAVVLAAASSVFVAPKNLEQPVNKVCLGASRNRSAQGVAHCTAHFFFLGGSIQVMEGRLLPGILL